MVTEATHAACAERVAQLRKSHRESRESWLSPDVAGSRHSLTNLNWRFLNRGVVFGCAGSRSNSRGGIGSRILLWCRRVRTIRSETRQIGVGKLFLGVPE